MMNKESIALQLLADAKRPLFGLEIVQQSEGKLSKWSIYLLLSSMEDAGHITSNKEELPKGEQRLARRLYIITQDGRRALANSDFLSNDAIGTILRTTA